MSKVRLFGRVLPRIMSHSLRRLSPWKISSSVFLTPCNSMFMRARGKHGESVHAPDRRGRA
jgi:hypothetical protein